MQNHCIPPCAENTIGLTFYRLILSNMAALNLVDILMATIYKLIGMANPFDPPTVQMQPSCFETQLHSLGLFVNGCSI